MAVVALQSAAGELRRAVSTAGAPTDAHGSAAAASSAPEVAPLRAILARVTCHGRVGERIRATVEEDGSLRDSASPELAAARRRRATADARARRALGGGGASVVTHMDRLCLSLPPGAPLPSGALLVGASRSGAVLSQLVEPASVVPLNNEREAAVAEERAAEVAARWVLTGLISAHADDFDGQLAAVAAVDAIAARARHASALRAVAPQLVPHGRGFFLEALRHPLLVERIEGPPWEGARARSARGASAGAPTATVVPVDIRVPPGARCVLLSGPNTGGKTAAAKALALAVLSARAGLFIPARVATLPWCDRVLADIGDEQSLSLSLSTFSGRLSRCHALLRAATPRSLVLLDELGAGTSPAAGAALGGALLGAFAAAAALTVATSHSGELKALKYTTTTAVTAADDAQTPDADAHTDADADGGAEHAEDASAPAVAAAPSPPPVVPMALFENAAAEFDPELLAPTYRLLWGVPGRSRALDIASRLGLDAGVVAAARARLGAAARGVEETVAALEAARGAELADAAEAAEAAAEAAAHRKDIDAALARLDKRRAALEADNAAAVARLAAVAAAAVARRRATTPAAAAAATQRSGAASTSASASAAPAATAAAPPAAATPASSPPAPAWSPRVGEWVLVSRLGSKPVEVSALSGDGREVTVRAGALQLRVARAEVSLAPASGAAAAARAKGRPKGSAAARWEQLAGRSKG
jgi:DNA mismatch repair protein MutS2